MLLRPNEYYSRSKINFAFYFRYVEETFFELLSQCADGNAETVETKQNLNSEIKA